MMKALVLAGGHGRRLRPLTYSGPKQLVPVANRAILDYALLRIVEAGISAIGVVVSPEHGSEIAAHLGDGARFGAKLCFIEQPFAGGLAHAVQVARPFLGDDPFLLYLGDNLIGASLAAPVAAFEQSSASEAWLWLKRVADPRNFGVAVVDAHGKVLSLVEKPAQPPSDLALVGVYLFRSSIHAAIDNIVRSPRGELEITDAISELMRTGAEVRFEELDDFWLDTGKKDDLLLANETILERWLLPEVQGSLDSESELVGPVRVEEGATLVRSRVVGPSIIGKNARLIDATVLAHCAIGEGVRIERSTLSRSVVLAEATIVDAGHLDSSLLGKRCRVERASAPVSSLHVGDDSEVVLPASSPSSQR